MSAKDPTGRLQKRLQKRLLARIERRLIGRVALKLYDLISYLSSIETGSVHDAFLLESFCVDFRCFLLIV